MNDVGHQYRRYFLLGLSAAFSPADAPRSSEATDEGVCSFAVAKDFMISDDKYIFMSLRPQDIRRTSTGFPQSRANRASRSHRLTRSTPRRNGLNFNEKLEVRGAVATSCLLTAARASDAILKRNTARLKYTTHVAYTHVMR
jgi:hypothetical protein